jgi:hypothetical protein
MDTEKLLRQKTVISYAYLLLALASFSLTFLLPDSPFYFIQDGHIPFSTYPRYGETFSFRALLIWLAGVLYFVHFYYGAFHFPRFYNEALRDRWSDYIEDFSCLRGYFATALVILYFSIIVLIKAEPVPALLKNNFWPWVALWVTINVILSLSSQTSFLFNFKRTKINLSIADPDGGHEEDEEASVGFYLPDEEQEHLFALAAAKAWLQDVITEREAEAAELARIRDFSNQAAAFKVR